MQRAKVHIPGIAEYRNVGVVVDRDETCWRIEDDEGRTFFARVAWSSVSDVKIGDGWSLSLSSYHGLRLALRTGLGQ